MRTMGNNSHFNICLFSPKASLLRSWSNDNAFQQVPKNDTYNRKSIRCSTRFVVPVTQQETLATMEARSSKTTIGKKRWLSTYILPTFGTNPRKQDANIVTIVMVVNWSGSYVFS